MNSPFSGSSRRLLLAAAACATVAAGLARSAPSDAADHNDPRRVQSTQFWNTASTEGADPAADIADLFAWNRQATPGSSDPLKDTLVLILTWRVDASSGASLDDTVRYGIHIDNGSTFSVDGDSESDHDLWIRHGKNAQGEWGVRIDNLPGLDGALVGPVGERLEVEVASGDHRGTTTVMSGLFDDPFVFDFDGFFYGLSVGQGNPPPPDFDEIANPQPDDRDPPFLPQGTRPFGFNNQNDTVAGVNVHAVVIEMPLRVVLRPATLFGTFKNYLNVWSTSARPSGQRNTEGG